MQSVLLVAAGSAAGGVCRYGISTWLAPVSAAFPWATLLINVAGCFGLGLLTGAGSGARLLLGTGFAGGFTTYSTWNAQIYGLPPASAGLYFTATVAGGLLAHAAGVWLGARLRGA